MISFRWFWKPGLQLLSGTSSEEKREEKYIFINKIWMYEWISSSRDLLETIVHPLWVVGRIRQPFPCVSYEATKRVSQWQRVYGVRLRRTPVQPLQSRVKRSGCRPKTLPLFSNLWCSIPTQLILNMIQHVSDWVGSFSSVVIIPLLIP